MPTYIHIYISQDMTSFQIFSLDLWAFQLHQAYCMSRLSFSTWFFALLTNIRWKMQIITIWNYAIFSPFILHPLSWFHIPFLAQPFQISRTNCLDIWNLSKTAAFCENLYFKWRAARMYLDVELSGFKYRTLKFTYKLILHLLVFQHRL
jgi:hypothetical protein